MSVIAPHEFALDSLRSLSADQVGPGQIELSPDARHLVVTEKMTTTLMSFEVGPYGKLSGRKLQPSAGMTPFGFEFTRDGTLLVSEAATTSLSSYDLGRRGARQVLGAAVSDTRLAPSWVALSAADRVAFTANAGSGTISSYDIADSDELALKDARAGDLGQGGNEGTLR